LKGSGGWKDAAVLTVASGLGAGYAPVAPGTAGSLLGLLLAYLLSGLTGLGGFWYPAVTVLLFLSGILVSGHAETIYGEKDCGKIVIDEVAGMLITLYLMPASPLYFALGFMFFRLFDITKPFPARGIDRGVKGGLGVMLDDVVAAIYANLCLHGVKALS
jgi:phosphatidylglycerophosphatase A